MMYGVWAANLLVIAIVAGLAYFINFSGIGFALGVIFGTAIYNIFHRLHHGYWI